MSSSTTNSIEQPSEPNAPRRRIGLGGWLLFAVTALSYFDIVMVGIDQTIPGSNGLWTMLWTGASVAYLHARRGKRGWAGFGRGLAFGFLGVVAAVFLHTTTAKLIRGAETLKSEEAMIDAASAIEPATAEATSDSKAAGTE
ncbi:MAG: hypothetical protein AB7Q00_16055 [Phycisphaerales bacterium]